MWWLQVSFLFVITTPSCKTQADEKSLNQLELSFSSNTKIFFTQRYFSHKRKPEFSCMGSLQAKSGSELETCWLFPDVGKCLVKPHNMAVNMNSEITSAGVHTHQPTNVGRLFLNPKISDFNAAFLCHHSKQESLV